MNATTVRLAEHRLYRLPEAATLLGHSRRWVRERVRAGELRAFSLPWLVVDGASINQYLAKRQVTVERNPQPAEVV